MQNRKIEFWVGLFTMVGIGLALGGLGGFIPVSESVAFNRRLYKVTRVRLAMGTFVAEPADIWGELERHQITHVVVGDLGISEEEDTALRRALAAAPMGRAA